MKSKLLTALIAALCASPALADDAAQYQDQARATAQSLLKQLGGELQKEMKAGGPVAAIKVCKDRAPAIASDLSRKNGEKVARVSLKVRNPLIGTPDAWEQKVLAEFDRKAAAGAKPETLETAEIVTEPQGKYFRYMKAVPTGNLCLACHGPAEKIGKEVKEQLSADYPHDKATGYGEGQIRGAITIKGPL
jgi:Protein of unknown function (DUF3365).